MKNFGLHDLVLVAPRCSLDRQAYSLASHAADVLDQAKVVGSAGEALAGRTRVLGTTARLRASPSFEILMPRAAVAGLPAEGGAVMFGPEDTGLSNSELDLCQATVRIPTADYASLNLAQAVNVIAYEWFVRSAPEVAVSLAAAAKEVEVAPREEIEPMVSQLLDTLLHIGYTDELKAPSVEHMFRRMFDRAGLSRREVAALRGLWSQARWAADQPPDAIPGRRRTR